MTAWLRALELSDSPERWADLGFALDGGSVWLGGVELRLGAAGHGIGGWSLSGIDPVLEIDGLATEAVPEGSARQVTHPNGALAVDHVVVLTGAFDRTAAALSDAGLALRRIRQVPERGIRQGFRRIGPAILELVEADGPARFWGLTVVVSDLESLAARLGEQLGTIRRAVQPGRRIATLRPSAGLGQAVAFMDPEPEQSFVAERRG